MEIEFSQWVYDVAGLITILVIWFYAIYGGYILGKLITILVEKKLIKNKKKVDSNE